MMASYRKKAVGCCLVVLFFSLGYECWGRSKDFTGLFGSYRREQYIENPAKSTSFGVDIMLSTLIPLSDIVKSTEDGGPAQSLYYATFFNQEVSLYFTLRYHWKFLLSIGHYDYETRRENAQRDITNPTMPLFHQFEMQTVPILAGVQYRLSTTDIVPYIGVGAGMAFSRRKAFYDNSATLFEQQFIQYVVGQALVGLDFYISPRVGVKLEVAAYYMALPGGQYDSLSGTFPIFYYQPNLWTVRSSSGLFVTL